MSDKTETPTPRRLRQARQRGDTPLSSALLKSLSFLAAWAVVPWAFLGLLTHATEQLNAAIRLAAAPTPEVTLTAAPLAFDILSLAAPLLLVATVVALGAGLVQTQGLFTVGPLSGGLGRLNPLTGLPRLFRPDQLLSVLRALLFATVVAVFGTRLVSSNLPSISATAGQLDSARTLAADLVRRLGWTAALLGLGLGLLDYALTYRAFLVRNRMTKEEVRREHREAEGDPHLIAARRRAHQEMLNQATLLAVRDATVLVANPTHLAVALRYRDSEDDAPVVLGQGEGELARHMIEAALRYGVPVVHDVPLAHALYELETGTAIPESLYEAVAEILREISATEPQAVQPTSTGRAP